MWVPPEDRDPVVRHAPTRKGVGYYGAVRLRDGRLVWRREEGRFNGDTYWSFLRHLRRVTAPIPRPVVAIEDNAGVPPRRPPPGMAGGVRGPPRPPLPPALQSGPEPDRARVEADEEAADPQSVLRLPGGGRGDGRGAIPRVAARQRGLAASIRNPLRRCV